MEVSLNLSKLQKSKLNKYFKNPEGSIVMSLKHKQLTGGDYKLTLPKRQYNHLMKCNEKGTGCSITINSTVLRLNKKRISGGEITTATIGAVIKPIQELASKLLTPEAEKRLDAKLAKLKGKGVDDEAINNLRDGFLYGLKSPDKGAELLWQLVNHFGQIDPDDVKAQQVANVEKTGKKVVSKYKFS